MAKVVHDSHAATGTMLRLLVHGLNCTTLFLMLGWGARRRRFWQRRKIVGLNAPAACTARGSKTAEKTKTVCVPNRRCGRLFSPLMCQCGILPFTIAKIYTRVSSFVAPPADCSNRLLLKGYFPGVSPNYSLHLVGIPVHLLASRSRGSIPGKSDFFLA